MLSPLLFWQKIVYLPKEHYCHIRSADILGMTWMMFVCYLLPFTSLLMIYIRITIFLNHHSSSLALIIQRRQQRDLVVIRRIFINVGILLISGMPSLVMIFMTYCSGVEHALSRRVAIINVETASLVLSIEMLVVTPQLKRIIMGRWQQNQVTPSRGRIQVRPITTAQ